MRRRLRFVNLVAAATLAAATSSCFAVTDLDRFGERAANTSNFNDLRLTVRGMTSHVLELFEYRIVDANNTIQSRGFSYPLGSVEATLFVPGAVPRQNGPFNLDFYADHDFSGGYDTDPNAMGDHSWRIPLDDSMLDDEGRYVILFDHNTSFTYLSNPAPPVTVGQTATVRLLNMGPLVGRRIEVRISDASSRRVVALYRIPKLADVTAPVIVTVEGMMEANVTYFVEVYTDDPAATSAPRSYRMSGLATREGLQVDFEPREELLVDDVTPP